MGKTMDDLRKLRDELRVKMHLAEMDTKAWWEDVEPRLIELENNIERGAEKASAAVDVFVDEMASALERIKKRISGED